MPNYRVIIADPCEERAVEFTGLLEREFRCAVTRVYSFDELAIKMPRGDGQFHLAIMAVGLPSNVNSLQQMVESLATLHRGCAFLAVVDTLPQKEPFTTKNTNVHVLLTPKRKVPINETKTLCKVLLPGVDSRAVLKLDPPSDHILKELLRRLDPKGQPDRAKKYLLNLAQNIRTARRVTVRRLTQGYSGAMVLCVELQPPINEGLLVLKIVHQNDLHKIRNEVDVWQHIEKSLGTSTLIRFLPVLVSPAVPAPELPSAVRSGQYFAIPYQFFGGGLGQFISLYDAYVLASNELKQRCRGIKAQGIEDLAQRILVDSISLLQHKWYRNSTIEERTLWSKKDASASKVLTTPPYMLSASHKARIMAALEELEVLGCRLLKPWRSFADTVSRWVDCGPVKDSWVSKSQPVLLSAAHGDLNASNVLFWLNETRPLFLDFTHYQRKGHAAQDLAKLEAEIKFSLMDQEHDSASDALCHTWQRLREWQKMEDVFLKPDLPAEDLEPWRKDHLDRPFAMVRWIRSQWIEEHATKSRGKAGSAVPGGDWFSEYAASLLYHTLNAIGYNSLSVFKRLLAVYSAAGMIEHLNQP